MRMLALVVLLAACDQGAKAAPPPPAPKPLPIIEPTPYTPFTVKSDEDFVAKANVIVEQMFAVFSQGGKDCKLVATGLRKMTAENRTKIELLTQYGDLHKSAEDALQKELQEPMQRFMPALTTTMTACASDQDLRAALDEMSAMKNLQRPR
jgi:hypothetical protein